MERVRLAIALILIVVATGGPWPSIARAQPEAYGLPPRLTSLTDLTAVHERKDLTPAQKTSALVAWLIEEREHPSATRRGLGGGDIDSGYTQAQILKALVQEGDPLVVSTMASDPDVDADVRAGMRIVLGLMGDRDSAPELIDILEAHPEADFRVGAAEALGSLGATEAAPALARALEDPFTRRAGSCTTRGIYTKYPVREAAQVALRVFTNPQAMAFSRERCEAFAKRLQQARESPLGSRTPRGWVQQLASAKPQTRAVALASGKTHNPKARSYAAPSSPREVARTPAGANASEAKPSNPVHRTPGNAVVAPSGGRPASAEDKHTTPIAVSQPSFGWKMPVGIAGAVALLGVALLLLPRLRNGRRNGGRM